jgi:hypothetical protein
MKFRKGMICNYVGTEMPWLGHEKVRVVGRIRYQGPARIEVQPWVNRSTPGIAGCEGPHWSFFTSDPLAADLRPIES